MGVTYNTYRGYSLNIVRKTLNHLLVGLKYACKNTKKLEIKSVNLGNLCGRMYLKLAIVKSQRSSVSPDAHKGCWARTF